MIIINGIKIRKEILEKVKNEVAILPFQPIFCDVLVGNDGASVLYVKMKEKTALSVGIKFHSTNFPSSITTNELIEEIKNLNKIPDMCGIIIQLPLPKHIDRQMVLNAIDPELDVDCLGDTASKKFYSGESGTSFPTALACVAVIESLKLDLKNMRIVILGQGMLVGKPVTALLQLKGLNPIIIDSKTENQKEILKDADMIISAIGRAKYITGDMVKKGVVLIDAGTSEDFGTIIGDVDLESIKEVAGYISPVPGGVGPVTVAMLLNNVLMVAKNVK